MDAKYSEIARLNQDYYDQDDTDLFYQKVSGGEHVHIGLFEREDELLEIAKQRTVESMASLVEIDSSSRVLDLGSGYGGTARFLAKKYGCHVTCLNISKKQNIVNYERNREQKLSQLINVCEGSFEDLAFPDSVFNIVWSQDAIFHTKNPMQVFSEVNRTLVDGGQFTFSVVMSNDDISEEERQLNDFYSTITNFYSLQTYRDVASKVGLSEVQFVDLSQNIAINYSRLLAKMEEIQSEDETAWSQEYFAKMKYRLNTWVEAGEKEIIKWGFLHFHK